MIRLTKHLCILALAVGAVVAHPARDARACGPYVRPTPAEQAEDVASQRVRELLPGLLVRGGEVDVEGDAAVVVLRTTRRAPDRLLQIVVSRDREGAARVEAERAVAGSFPKASAAVAATDAAEAERVALAHLAKNHPGLWADVVGARSRGGQTILDVRLTRVHAIRVGLVRRSAEVWAVESVKLPASMTKKRAA